MPHPMTTQIKLEFAAAMRQRQPGGNVKFKTQFKPSADETGFYVATCLDENGIPVVGIEPIKFRPN